MKHLLRALGIMLMVAGIATAAQSTISTNAGVVTEQDKTSINSNFTELYGKTTTAAPVVLCYTVGDETTNITTGTAKLTVRAPFAFTLTDLRASVNTAPVGATILLDVNEGGTTVISTKVMIDAAELTSVTATTPYVISDAAIADDASITVDIDQVGSSTAGKGVKLCLLGTRAW
jgi:hypothetical protein